MAELTNPLFEDQKEFLERQKLEYERALLGDVDHIKEKTQEIGKKALIGAGVVGGVWLLAKLFGGKKKELQKGESTIRLFYLIRSQQICYVLCSIRYYTRHYNSISMLCDFAVH